MELKVFFLPASSNPYQYLLANALRKQGVRIEHLSSLPSCYWLMKNRKKVQIFHIHWLHILYYWERKTPVRFIGFVIKLIFARLLGYKIVWTVHNFMPHERTFPLIDILGRFTITTLANALIVHCKYAKNEITRKFFRKKNIYIIGHGNYIEKYPCSISKERARQFLGINANAFVYLFFVKIRPYKGVEALVKSFQQIRTNNTILLVGGKGKHLAKKGLWSNIAKNNSNIKLFMNFIPDEEIQCFFMAADVLVIPFLNVLTSGSIILGLSFGLPVIAPSLGCLPELITPQAGVLYDPLDSEGLLNALLSIREKDREKMRYEVNKISKRLNWDMIGRKTKQVYLECCGYAE